MSAIVVSQHFGCTGKTIECLQRQFCVTGNADCPRSGKPSVTNAADDRNIVLQHLRSRHLTAAASGRQYGIHPQTVRNRLRQNVKCIRTILWSNSHLTSSNGKVGLVLLSPALLTC